MGSCHILPKLASYGDVDTSILTLRFQNGAIGVIQNSRRTVYGHDVRVEVMGSAGKAVGEVERATPVWTYLKDGIHGDYANWFIDRFRDAYRLELQAFVEALQQGVPPSPGPNDAIQSLRVALAATKSLSTKQTIHLDEYARSLSSRTSS